MREGGKHAAATRTVLNPLRVPRALLPGELRRRQLGRRSSLGTSARQHWRRFGDAEDTVQTHGVFLHLSGRHWPPRADASPCPLRPSCPWCRRTEQPVGCTTVASALNGSSCAHSWPRHWKNSPCFVAVRLDSGLGGLRSAEPAALGHGDLCSPTTLPGYQAERRRGRIVTICTTSSRVIWLSPGSSCVKVLRHEKTALLQLGKHQTPTPATGPQDDFGVFHRLNPQRVQECF